MKLTVTQGEAPWEPGQSFDATFPVQLVVVWGEAPWETGRKLTATLDAPPSDMHIMRGRVGRDGLSKGPEVGGSNPSPGI